MTGQDPVAASSTAPASPPPGPFEKAAERRQFDAEHPDHRDTADQASNPLPAIMQDLVDRLVRSDVELAHTRGLMQDLVDRSVQNGLELTYTRRAVEDLTAERDRARVVAVVLETEVDRLRQVVAQRAADLGNERRLQLDASVRAFTTPVQ